MSTNDLEKVEQYLRFSFGFIPKQAGSLLSEIRELRTDRDRLASETAHYAAQQAASVANEQELRMECERLKAEIARLQSAAVPAVDDRERCAAVCDREADLFDGPGNSDIRRAIVCELRHAANTIRNLPSLPACQPVQQEAGIPHVRKDTTTSYFLAIGTNGHPLGHPRLFVTADAAETALRLEFGDDFRATKPPAVAEQEPIPERPSRCVSCGVQFSSEAKGRKCEAPLESPNGGHTWQSERYFNIRDSLVEKDREIQALRETMQECAEKIRDLTSPDIPIESWSAWFGGFNSIADRLDAGHAEMANGG